jgi:hypothetical protein
MSQYVPDVNLVSIIMQSRNQSNSIAADVENRELSNLISVRKCRSQLREIFKAMPSHDRVPARER